MNSEAKALIEKFQMSPHPEGGYYREVFRSELTIHSPAVAETRQAATHIYFLLAKGEKSLFHRVAHDEIWHLYQGAPLELILYDGARVSPLTIGQGEKDYAAVVPGNVWQAARSTGDYSFMGCTVAPGFDFMDFSFLRDNPGEKEALAGLKSGYEAFI